MKPLISIITPTFNSSAFIEQCIRSVQAQSFRDWEQIIVDDGSTDDTVSRVSALAAGDSRIQVVALSCNGGAAKARNVAIERAAGRYIAFLDSDDLWLPEKLELQLALLQSSGAPLVYGAYYRISDRSGSSVAVSVPPTLDYGQLLNNTAIATLTAMYDTAVTGKVFMPGIRKRQDYATWLRILRQGGVARAVTQPVAKLRKRGGSLSSNKLSAIAYTWRVYRECERLSLPRTLYHFLNYLVRAVLKAV